MEDATDHLATTKKQKWENWKTFLTFFALSLLEIWVLFSSKLSLDKWQGWLILGGAIAFPVMAIISFFAAYRDWSPEKADEVAGRTWAWLIGTPIALAIAAWIAISVFGWLGGIPSWAAVIIVLLVLILLKR